MNKKNKIIVLTIGLVFLLSGCSDSFLDTLPTDTVTDEQVKDKLAKDPSYFQAYITGFYKNLFYPESMAEHDEFGLKALSLATDFMTDDMARLMEHFFFFDYELDNRSAPFRRTGRTWQQLYAVISGANEVISGLVFNFEDMEDEQKLLAQRMLGESYTVRAFCYFWLINMYQQPYEFAKDKPGIPIYNENETRLERVIVKEVYDQILSDIDKGYNFLKDIEVSSDKSALNKYAAAGIFAKILSFVSDYPNQWTEVAKYAELAIAGGKLMNEKELLSGFNDINLPEVLWGADITSESNSFYASFFSHIDPYCPGYGGNVGIYKMIASDLYDAIPDGDIRKKWYGVNFLPESNPHYKFSKYIQVKFLDVSTTKTGDHFSSDYIYLRTAEMYLLASEAYFKAGNESKAIEKLEELVKTRNPQYAVAVSGNDLLKEIMLQKRIEMWGEGTRLLDMKRNNEALNRKGAINHNITIPMEISANNRLFIYQIPQNELNANSEIKEQND